MRTTATRQIKASPQAIANVMFDPRRDPEWIGGAKSVDPPKGRPDRNWRADHTSRRFHGSKVFMAN